MTPNLSFTDRLRVTAARRAFESARSRYIRARIAEHAAVRLRPLQRERAALIVARDRMQAALDFHVRRLAHARNAYERELPGRTWGANVQRPTLLDRIVTCGHSERLYRELRLWVFCRDEVATELGTCRERLALLGREIESIMRAQEATIERRLDSPLGLREALAGDPQLALAHARLTQVADGAGSTL